LTALAGSNIFHLQRTDIVGLASGRASDL